MMIQLFAHVGGGALGYHGLNHIGQVFERTVKNNGHQINPAIGKQHIDFS